VLVEEGDVVREGQTLAELDPRDIEAQVAQAEASLAQAQASYQQLLDGATAEEVAAAQAQVAQAAAGLRQVRGSVTDADIAAAQAQYEQAQLLLARLEAGPKETDLQQAQAAVTQAQSNLNLQRDSLSAQKTRAELQVEQVANQLRDAQAQYSQIYWNNRDLEATLDNFGRELPQEARDAEAAALRQVQNLEASLESARVALEQARQAEIDGIAAAEAQLANAQAIYTSVLAGVDDDQIAAARAQVAAALANLNKLRGEQRAGSVQQAQAGVTAAQANLERLLADPTTSRIAAAEAQVQAAEAGLQQALLNREKAALTAPFAGIVAIVNIDPGDAASTGNQPAIQVVDIGQLRVEANISDADIVRVREGQTAEVRVDALPNEVFVGTVDYIAPTATVNGTIRTYKVRINLDKQDKLRAGMNVRVAIQP
jgi:HlyD family secretion protein